jgi:CDP-diacylglycerol pyrophosphatase
MIVDVPKLKPLTSLDHNFLGHNFYGSRVTQDDFTCLSLALFTEQPVTTAEESAIRLSSLIYDSGYNSFALLNIYKRLLNENNLNWSLAGQRPADCYHP